MSPDTPPPIPRPTPKGRSGCLTALYIILGVGVFLFLVTAIGLWIFFRSETGQRVLEVAGEGITLVREATTAPGTDALRTAGCDQAMVLPLGRMEELFGAIATDVPGAARGGRAAKDETLVVCQMQTLDGTAPDCAAVARVYAGAVPAAPEQFNVSVQTLRGSDSKCQGVYTRDGTRVEAPERE